MRRAKIVCTIGPASSSEEALTRMIHAGMNVARLNFSHGSHEDHLGVYRTLRALSRDMKKPVAILQDLQGPKIRVGKFGGEGAIVLEQGDEFIITMDDVVGDQDRVSTTYTDLARDVSAGHHLLLDDGLLRLRVVDVVGTDIYTEVEVGGKLSNNKGINVPSANVSAPSLTPKDIIDLEFGLELGVDYLALSFVRSALDIHQLRARLPKQGGPKIISKIEKPQAVEVLEDIVSVSDGIMIARGDLGVELPPQRVPIIQKRAIRLANSRGRIAITATQMLESMIVNPLPTRAEASDVANAVLDGTDAVMLSGETATGKYPIEAVQMMANIITEVEGSPLYRSSGVLDPPVEYHLRTFPKAAAHAATVAARALDVKGIVVLTLTGSTARLLKSYRPETPIFACTPDEQLARQMALYWGVHPYHVELELESEGGTVTYTAEAAIERIEAMLRGAENFKTGDEVVVVLGSPVSPNAETNMVKFHRIGG